MALAILVAIVGCGQKGPLYLPTDPAAAQRATLPQALNPAASTAPTPSASQPAAAGIGTAAPVRNP